MIVLIRGSYGMKKRGEEGRKKNTKNIVCVFDGMRNDSRLLRQPKRALPLIYFANARHNFREPSSGAAPIDLRNENCLGFDDILNCCRRDGKLSVTATNVSV